MTERERYRLKHGSLPVAWSEGPDALRKIKCYALIHSQDAPVTIERHAKGKWQKLVEAVQ